eukprot:GHVL01035488.1.p1 GENE.GHVL01035488.1~~GHVL01035488.1.p1  ORF type:complete len:103 (+),score=15.11 GHVL01035488.1:217-525(+)
MFKQFVYLIYIFLNIYYIYIILECIILEVILRYFLIFLNLFVIYPNMWDLTKRQGDVGFWENFNISLLYINMIRLIHTDIRQSINTRDRTLYNSMYCDYVLC